MTKVVEIQHYIAAFSASPLARWNDLFPWQFTAQSSAIVLALLAELPTNEYVISDEIAVHRSTIVESGAVLKSPLILGADCFVATGAYLRGGSWVAENCTFGPGSELKSSFVFPNTKLAHFNFVGDSMLGESVNLEAGSIVCNYRNEKLEKEVLVRIGSQLLHTGSDKFGALIGDDSRIGANAVIAPGALLLPSAIVRRADLCDQEVSVEQTRG